MFKNEKEAQHAEIEKTISHYFKGYLKAEPETLLKAFHRDARLFSSDQGKLDRTEMADWIVNLEARRAKGDIRQADAVILGVDVSGDAAVAKVRLTFPKFAFTDYLSLLLVDNQWTIINKIYSTETLESSK